MYIFDDEDDRLIWRIIWWITGGIFLICCLWIDFYYRVKNRSFRTKKEKPAVERK